MKPAIIGESIVRVGGVGYASAAVGVEIDEEQESSSSWVAARVGTSLERGGGYGCTPPISADGSTRYIACTHVGSTYVAMSIRYDIRMCNFMR